MGLCLKEDKRQRENAKAVLKIAAKISADPKAQALGATDMEHFHWLWKKYTRSKYYDPATIRIEESDVKLFELGVKEWQKGLTKRSEFFGRNFKLPKALAGGVKGGQDFITRVGEAVSYNQRQMKEGSKQIDEMTQGLYNMFNDEGSSIIAEAKAGWSKKDYKHFRSLERDLMLADPNTKAQTDALDAVIGFIGSGTKGDPLGGKILRRYQKLLSMEALPETPNEENIVHHWNILRADSMKNLLNASISARRTIETLQEGEHRSNLVKAYETLQEQIDALLVEGGESLKKMSNEYREQNGIFVPEEKSAFMIYDPVTKTSNPYVKINSATGEQVMGIKQYSPKYVIELTDIMQNLSNYAKSPDKALWNNMTPEQITRQIETEINPSAISNRLKVAGETEKYWSLDPIYYLNKYVHDVASFNMRSRINHAYAEATIPIVEAIRRNNAKGGDIEVGEYSGYLLDVLTEVKDSALMQGGATNGLDHAVRLINAFEYISKLGFSVRGGLKNRTQGLFNWVRYGTRGYRISRDFKNTSTREYDSADAQDLTNEAMIKRQLKRFGLMIGVKKEAAKLSAATAGSLDMVLIPKGFDVDNQGRLIVAGKDSNLKRAADATAWAAEKTSGMMRWAENRNRNSTFEMAFAHSFLAEKNRKAYHKKALIEGGIENPTNEQIYDRIENIAGNEAFEMVKFLHYDYDNWAKAKILRSGGEGMWQKTGAGRVVGQYQHFKFAFFDMQYNMIKDGMRDVKAFKFTEKDPTDPTKTIVSQNFSQMMRLVSLYSLVPGLIGLVTDYDVGGVMSAFGNYLTPFQEDRRGKGDRGSATGLIENPVIEEASKLLEFFANSKDGDMNEQSKHYSAYYGKGPITGSLGPFISDILTAAELTDFLNLTGAEYAEQKKLNYDPNDPDWWYNVSRIFSIQGSRTFWKTIPAAMKGQWEKIARMETGAYKPKWITKWREKQVKKLAKATYGGSIAPGIDILPTVKFKEKSRDTSRINKRALASLAGL